MDTIAVIGGTGQLGTAIARRLAKAGRDVTLGSRDERRARSAAADLARNCGRELRGTTNMAAAAAADIVILAVPFAVHAATLKEIRGALAGKLLIDATVPLVAPKVMRVQLPPEGSAAVAAQRLLGSDTTVAAAFHNVPAHKLVTDEAIDCDVLVFGDERATRDRVIGIVEACGLRGLHAGPLVNSTAAEAL
ncbi:MAG TPA: NADPH-dependent F420 reductase, partial [Steroidobacteraceae bacterium]